MVLQTDCTEPRPKQDLAKAVWLCSERQQSRNKSGAKVNDLFHAFVLAFLNFSKHVESAAVGQTLHKPAHVRVSVCMLLDETAGFGCVESVEARLIGNSVLRKPCRVRGHFCRDATKNRTFAFSALLNSAASKMRP